MLQSALWYVRHGFYIFPIYEPIGSECPAVALPITVRANIHARLTASMMLPVTRLSSASGGPSGRTPASASTAVFPASSR